MYYLNLVVLPQGVLGYFKDLVRPPCGWSTGFIATPLTLGFRPVTTKLPALVLFSCLRKIDMFAEPSHDKEKAENTFFTPDGSLTKLNPVLVSSLIKHHFCEDKK